MILLDFMDKHPVLSVILALIIAQMVVVSISEWRK